MDMRLARVASLAQRAGLPVGELLHLSAEDLNRFLRISDAVEDFWSEDTPIIIDKGVVYRTAKRRVDEPEIASFRELHSMQLLPGLSVLQDGDGVTILRKERDHVYIRNSFDNYGQHLCRTSRLQTGMQVISPENSLISHKELEKLGSENYDDWVRYDGAFLREVHLREEGEIRVCDKFLLEGVAVVDTEFYRLSDINEFFRPGGWQGLLFSDRYYFDARGARGLRFSQSDGGLIWT